MHRLKHSKIRNTGLLYEFLLRQITVDVLNKDTKNYSGIKYTYDGKSQQFTLNFKYKLLGIDVSIHITSRTRAAGGWAGKSLYINTPGIKVK